MYLTEVIKEKRPHLSDSSLRTYKSILTNLYRKCYPSDNEIKLDKFDNEKLIMEHLKDIPFSKRKTTLAALVVLTGNKEYNKLMSSDISEYNDKQLLQEKDGKFADNMIPFSEVEAILKAAEKEAKIIYKKDKLEMGDYQKIQNYILLALTGGIYMPPRRSLDWVMRHKNYSEKDNYVDLKKKVFVFNSYKTMKSKGQQVIEIPKPLLVILKKWIGSLPEDMDYILFDNKGNAITPSQITHRLNIIFNKPISTSMLRHIFLTSKFADVNLKELTNVADAMGNSPLQALAYVKN
jgi:integrase